MNKDEKLRILRDYLKSKGLTQKIIAEKLGLQQPYVSDLLTGQIAFSSKQAEKWSSELDISPAFLLTGIGDITLGSNNNVGDNSTLNNVFASSPENQTKNQKKLEEENEELKKQVNDLTRQLIELNKELTRTKDQLINILLNERRQ